MTTNKIEDVAKRRGFFWVSSEIYGGLSGFYDYGHLGTLLKRRWENLWRDYFLGINDNFYEIECCNIMPKDVFLASGHLQNFVDPIVRCKKCKSAERADHIIEDQLKESFEGLSPEALTDIIKKHSIRCPKCKGELSEVGILNMMFPINIGAESTPSAYLRPETAQSPYVNFSREFECLRKRLPLGLAVVGRAYRNEISPRNSLIRMREFTQAELQIFFDPDLSSHPDFGLIKDYKLRLFPASSRPSKKVEEVSATHAVNEFHLPEFYVYHMCKIQQFYLELLKISPENFRFKQLKDEEKAFYNKYHWDIELHLSEGFKEVGGIHYRTDHDLSGHQKVSKQDMSVNLEGKKFIPHVLELSFGVDRNLLALMEMFYHEEEERSLFRFPRVVSPYDCAVFPLLSKDGLPEVARRIKKMLGSSAFYDESGSIGRRYRRMDEIGVAASITIDHQTLEDGTVTLRDRDTMKQVRIHEKDLPAVLIKFIKGCKIEDLE